MAALKARVRSVDRARLDLALAAVLEEASR